MTIAQKLLPEFDEEFAMTRRFLEKVPDDKLTWKPHEKSMELGRLAWHITDMPEWCRDTLTNDFLQLTEADGEKARHGWKGKTRADMLARFDRELPEARALLGKASEPIWPITGKWSGAAKRLSTARASKCSGNGCSIT